MNQYKIIFSLAIIFLISCQTSSKNDLRHIVNEWQGKEILIPAYPEYRILGRDTLCFHLWEQSYKILTYIDSIGCTSCRLHLPEWKQLIDSCRLQNVDIAFHFVIHSNNYKKFEQKLVFEEFLYPVIYDHQNQFHKLNQFPPEPYRTFLLDKNNKVLLIGSPIDNSKMWELYKKTITQTQ